MDIGKRNHQLIIQRVTTANISTGAPTETWNTVTTVWANRKPMNQKRALENGVENLQGVQVFNFLYYDYPTLDRACRLQNDGITYVIHSIVQNEKIDFTVIAKTKL